MGAVEIGDLLSEQISTAEKENEPKIQNGDSEIDNEEFDKELEPAEKVATQETGKENISETDDDKK